MSDTISLIDARFFGFHGVHPEEQSRGQRFEVDLELTVDLSRAAETDALEDTVNYSAVFNRVRAVMEGPPRNLLETVATEIARTVLHDFPAVETVTVTVRKPEVGIRHAALGYAAVRIVRDRRLVRES